MPKTTYGHETGIAQQSTRSLTSFQGSKELVSVLRDVLKAIGGAHRAGIPPRTVSFDTVAITQDGVGILSDLDDSRQLPLGLPSSFRPESDVYFRNGAWKFLSVRMLQEPGKEQTISDDVEAVYWLLLYCALHWLPHNELYFDMTLFDEAAVEDREGRRGTRDSVVVGGKDKSYFLTHGKLGSLRFASDPLNDLLRQFDNLLQIICVASMPAVVQIYEAIRDEANVAMEKLRDIDFMVKMFDDALGREDWPKDDRVQDQFPPKTEREKRREAEEARLLRLFIAEGRPYR